MRSKAKLENFKVRLERMENLCRANMGEISDLKRLVDKTIADLGESDYNDTTISDTRALTDEGVESNGKK